MDNHYNPVIFAKLKTLTSQCNWTGMLTYLRSLSNSGFRTASYLLKERLLPLLEANDYWQCFSVVALTDTKAFLMTFLQAGAEMYMSGTITFDDPRFVAFANQTAPLPSSLDRKKSLLLLLPIIKTPEEIQKLLTAFCQEDDQRKIAYLIEAKESAQCYFVLFQLLRKHGDEPDTLRHTLMLVLKRSTPMAFNFVSMARSYFDVAGLNGRFSLKIEPYQLSLLESDYPTFLKILNQLITK